MSTVEIPSAQAALFGNGTLAGAEDASIRVSVIDKALAEDVIRAGHYSGSTCWASSLHFGVYHADELIGALQYGPLMNPASADKIVKDADPREAMELNRMWLADEKPANTATRALSLSIRVLRSRRPEVRWLQTFADERCGKLGGVYQAASFLYCGEHMGVFYEIDGEWFHRSMLGRNDKRGWGTGPKIARFNREADRAVERRFRQFRYIRPLSRSARRRLLLPVLPYPKPNAKER